MFVKVEHIIDKHQAALLFCKFHLKSMNESTDGLPNG